MGEKTRHKKMYLKLYKYALKQSNNDFLLDWRERCLEILMNCYRPLDNAKVYFKKTKDIKIMPLNQQISERIMDLGMIRKLLTPVDHLGLKSYTNQFQFYKDMKLLWKKSRNLKYFNQIITKSRNKGGKTFSKEWDRLFVKKKPLDHKILSNKISDDSNIRKKQKKNIHKQRTKKNPKKKKNKAQNKKIIYHNPSFQPIKKRSVHELKTKETPEEITSLMDALIRIAYDPKTTEFKQMVEIIKDAGELNINEVGEIEVDLGKLGFETLKKLQFLAKNLKIK